MSRKGNCHDNAVMENFFGLMKQEMYYGVIERCIIYLDSMKRDFLGERSVFYEESKNVHQGFQNPGMQACFG